MPLELITTTAGRDAVLEALASKTAISVSHVLVSPAAQTVSPATTSLAGVVRTLSAQSSVRRVGDGHLLHIVATDDSADEYEARALALRLTTGVLLMVYAQNGAIAQKAAESSLLLSFQVRIDPATAAATLDFGDTNFALPAATTDRAGITRYATTEETVAGTASDRAITPASLPRASASMVGLTRYATEAEAVAGSLTDRAVTPAGVAAALSAALAPSTFWIPFLMASGQADPDSRWSYVPPFSFADTSNGWLRPLTPGLGWLVLETPLPHTAQVQELQIRTLRVGVGGMRVVLRLNYWSPGAVDHKWAGDHIEVEASNEETITTIPLGPRVPFIPRVPRVAQVCFWNVPSLTRIAGAQLQVQIP